MHTHSPGKILRKVLAILLSVILCLSTLTACSITDMIDRGSELINALTQGNTEPSDAAPVATIPISPKPSGTAPTEPTIPPATEPIVVPTEPQEVRFFVVITDDECPVYASPSYSATKVQTHKYGQRIGAYSIEDGWVRLSNGWVEQDAVYMEGFDPAKPVGYGICTGSDVNLREGPGLQHNRLGYYNEGDLLHVLFEFYYDGFWWAYTGIGWVCMDYVYINGTMGAHYGFATVTGDVVNIRLGPGTHNQIVRTVKEGDVLEVFHYITYKNVKWACVEDGWICMDYVKFIEY